MICIAADEANIIFFDLIAVLIKTASLNANGDHGLRLFSSSMNIKSIKSNYLADSLVEKPESPS
jgi:hypothetical protein